MTGYLIKNQAKAVMPRPPNPAVRSRLVSAGHDVVLNQGFNGCGVQEITAAAGVPKGSFYNYFASKEAFASEILETYWQSIEVRHVPHLRDARIKPLDRITRFFRAISDDHAKHGFKFGCLIGNLSIELSNCSDETRQRLSSILSRWEALLAGCLREAQKQGDLRKGRDATQIAAILVEAYEGAIMRGKVEHSAKACERFEKIVLPLLLG
jgi:TetR/AcrR family transcriptional regulator, transcriptional repressor for nem operon